MNKKNHTSLGTSSDTSNENKTPIPIEGISNPVLNNISNPLLNKKNEECSDTPQVVNHNHFYGPNTYPFHSNQIPYNNNPVNNSNQIPYNNNPANNSNQIAFNNNPANNSNQIPFNNNPANNSNQIPFNNNPANNSNQIPFNNNSPDNTNDPIYDENQIPMFNQNKIPVFNPNNQNPGIQTYYMNNNSGSPILVTNEVIDDYDDNYKTPDQYLKKKPKHQKKDFQSIPINIPEQSFSIKIPHNNQQNPEKNPEINSAEDPLEENLDGESNRNGKNLLPLSDEESNRNGKNLLPLSDEENMRDGKDLNKPLEENLDPIENEDINNLNNPKKDNLETPIDEVDDISEEEEGDKPFYPLDTVNQHHEIVVKGDHKIHVTLNNFKGSSDEYVFEDERPKKKKRREKKKLRKRKRKLRKYKKKSRKDKKRRYKNLI